jgi:hypothetical protein
VPTQPPPDPAPFGAPRTGKRVLAAGQANTR